MIRVTVWNEGVHEVESPEIAAVYPHGIHGQIKSFLDTQEDIEVRTATLNDPDCGLPPEVLENTDVLIWWGHKAHDEVPDELVERVHDRVLRGMGFIALHSAHFSKPFKRLMGTSCALHWRDGDFERLWTVNPAHPIAKGIGEYIEIPVEEMYGERFDIPEPDEQFDIRIDGYDFKVLSVENKMIKTVLVKKLPEESGAACEEQPLSGKTEEDRRSSGQDKAGESGNK